MFEKYEGEVLEKLLKLKETLPMFDPMENQDMTYKCCRLGFLQTREQIVHVFNVHGEDIEVFDATFPSNEELGEPDEPKHGMLMQEYKEGYPCDALTEEGCKFQGPNKPWSCKRHPVRESKLITTCNYEFDEEGKRTGECNGCKV